MKRLIIAMLLATFLLPNRILASEVVFDPNLLLTDTELADMAAMSKADLVSFLWRGSLGTLTTKDANGITRPAADIIWNAAQTFRINPQFILVLLQREQSLVDDPHPSQDQLDWAMGYGICDDCSKTDPRLVKFKGFGNQIHYATKRIRESFLTDLETRGYTESGIGPGRIVLIDNVQVNPVNAATASLYTYTPHLHGNQNFSRIWNAWFTRLYLNGSLLQDETTGGIWLIQNDKRRPITSRSALQSRFNSVNIVSTSPRTLEAYMIGKPISFPNYSLLRSPLGTIYLLVDDTKRGFISMEAFRSNGFNTDEIIDVELSDLSGYSEGLPITLQTTYAQGALLQDKTSGGVFYIEENRKHPIMSREILKARFENLPIEQVTTESLVSFETADPALLPDGILVGVKGSPDVFIISEGKRHLIEDEETFLAYGWKWNQIIWTNERSVLLHPLTDELTNPFEHSEEIIETL